MGVRKREPLLFQLAEGAQCGWVWAGVCLPLCSHSLALCNRVRGKRQWRELKQASSLASSGWAWWHLLLFASCVVMIPLLWRLCLLSHHSFHQLGASPMLCSKALYGLLAEERFHTQAEPNRIIPADILNRGNGECSARQRNCAPLESFQGIRFLQEQKEVGHWGILPADSMDGAEVLLLPFNTRPEKCLAFSKNFQMFAVIPVLGPDLRENKRQV